MTRSERFEEMFEATHRAVLAYALRRTAGPADAEDAVADTFAVAWRKLDSVPDDPLPWLYAVARRVLANQRRGNDRRFRLGWRIRPAAQAEPVTLGDADDGPAMSALRALREDDRELLRLVAWEELDHRQIGQVLGISPNAVAIRLHRARRRFADELARVRSDRLKGSASSRTSMPVKGMISGGIEREQDT